MNASIWVIACFVLAGLSPAHAIECGDTLGPGGSFKLENDLVCNIDGPALRLLSGAKLDLRGNTVECVVPSAFFPLLGIVLDGKGAAVTNGTVFHCDVGVWLRDEGHHVVRDVRYDISGAAEVVGFLVESDENRLSRNSATLCGECLIISGNNNTLYRNIVFDSPGLSFVIRGNNNRFLRNTSDDAYFRAFEISGGDNILIRNEATGTNEDHDFAAFEIGGENNKVIRNTATENAIGFRVSGSGNHVTRNEAENNDTSGIQVAGTDNTMLGNTALGNGDGVTGFDLEDQNPNCDSNTWRRNTFYTHNIDCIE